MKNQKKIRRALPIGDSKLQQTFIFAFGIIGAYLSSILFYLAFLLIVQIVRLFVCTCKPLVIRFRVFDIILDMSKKKIIRDNDRELDLLLYGHYRNVRERKEKREDGKERACENSARYKEQQAQYHEEQIRAKERALGKNRRN